MPGWLDGDPHLHRGAIKPALNVYFVKKIRKHRLVGRHKKALFPPKCPDTRPSRHNLACMHVLAATNKPEALTQPDLAIFHETLLRGKHAVIHGLVEAARPRFFRGRGGRGQPPEAGLEHEGILLLVGQVHALRNALERLLAYHTKTKTEGITKESRTSSSGLCATCSASLPRGRILSTWGISWCYLGTWQSCSKPALRVHRAFSSTAHAGGPQARFSAHVWIPPDAHDAVLARPQSWRWLYFAGARSVLTEATGSQKTRAATARP